MDWYNEQYGDHSVPEKVLHLIYDIIRLYVGLDNARCYVPPPFTPSGSSNTYRNMGPLSPGKKLEKVKENFSNQRRVAFLRWKKL